MADTYPQDVATFPIAQADETPLTLWAYPEMFQVSGGEFTTFEWQQFALTPVALDSLHASFEQMRATVLQQKGQIVLGYGIFVKGVTDYAVPRQFCVDGAPIGIPIRQCWDVPLEFCFPFTDICIGLGGQTVASGFLYRFWCVTATPPASGLYRPIVGVDDIGILIIVIGALLALGVLFGGIALLSGKITWPQFTDGVRGILRSPGENLAAPITAASWPFMALGVVIIGMGVVIPIAVAKAGGTPGAFSGGVEVAAPIPGLPGSKVGVTGGVGRGR
jgi:hypothetical protein